jgi:hypothetical protein
MIPKLQYRLTDMPIATCDKRRFVRVVRHDLNVSDVLQEAFALQRILLLA